MAYHNRRDAPHGLPPEGQDGGQSANRVAARFGGALTHAVPARPDDVAEQHALLRAVHAERPDTLLIAPAHAAPLNGTLRAMQEDGSQIPCFVSRPDAFEPTCFVGSDDRALACGIAHHLFDRLGGRGGVVALEGHPIPTPSPRRRAPPASARRTAERPDVGIANARTGYYLRDGDHLGIARTAGGRGSHRWRALSMPCVRRHGRSPSWASTPRRKAWRRSRRGRLLVAAAFDAMKLACLGVEAAFAPWPASGCPPRSFFPLRWSSAPTAAPGTCPTGNAHSWTGRSASGAKGAPTATPELEIVAAHNFPLRRTTRVGKLWAVSRLRGEAPRK